MTVKPDTPIDRRDFLFASAVTAGAAAAIFVPGHAVQAQVTPAQTLPGGTAFNGDIVQGKPVITALNCDDLESGQKHLFYFQGAQMPTGQPWYIAVMVAKGAKPGKRVALISGVHGDEISSIHAVQTVMTGLNPVVMAGTVTAVFDVSRPALETMARRWPNTARGVDLVDLNRLWPGNEDSPIASVRHAGLLFNRVIRPNADYALDFHTGTSGTDVSAFNLARMDLPDVNAMVQLFPVAHVYDNFGAEGLLANALIDAGIPAFTPEIGRARAIDRAMVPDFVEGTLNVLKLHGILSGPMGRTGKDVSVFVGQHSIPVMSTEGGYVEVLVNLSDRITVGQQVAIQRNAFGEVVAEYFSPVAGEVGALRSDATAEPGNPLVVILVSGETPQKEATLTE
jgi:uncharacterized protein